MRIIDGFGGGIGKGPYQAMVGHRLYFYAGLEKYPSNITAIVTVTDPAAVPALEN